MDQSKGMFFIYYISLVMLPLGIASDTAYMGGKSGLTAAESFDNNTKPVLNCDKTARIKEEQSRGTFVFKIHAIDNDPPDMGGTVTYSIVAKNPSRAFFNINNVTGDVFTEFPFDRDEPSRTKELYVTVQATDNGRPPLQDVCIFKVIIEDINDNVPSFDTSSYDEKVSVDLKEGREVMRVFAYDSDDGDNARLTYSFLNPEGEFEDYFTIDDATGVIYLKQSLSNKNNFVFKSSVSVRDNPKDGNPLSAAVPLQIEVVGSDKHPPRFTHYPEAPINLAENYSNYDDAIITLTAESDIEDPELQFQLLKGKTAQTNKDQTFKLIQEGQSAKISLARALDYETVTEYKLTVRVVNKDQLAASVDLTINISDVNDEIPEFIGFPSGSVIENEPPGQVALTVRAVDKDGTSPNNIVRYQILDKDSPFSIDEETGIITSRVNFDRETKDVYHVNVRAYDSAPSALYKEEKPNDISQVFKIFIEDRNDNKPVFKQSQYVADNIPESANIGTVVLEVQAVDKDGASVITYSIKDGNTDDAFAIEESTGRIRVHKELDFEKVESYNLTVRAYDGIYEDAAMVTIRIQNENDEKPVFEPYNKNITGIEEESIPNSCIISLLAYDPDIKDRNANQRIVYKVNKDFLSVTDEDGRACVKLIKALDRDKPNGYPVYQAYIFAHDNDGNEISQAEAAEINIILQDINDNAPFLKSTNVVYEENQKPTTIMTLTADDYDDPSINGPPFTYRISDNADASIRDMFEIVSDELIAKVEFDREQQKYYQVKIQITDNGKPPQTGENILVVEIGDVNDNPAKPGSSEIFVYSYEDAKGGDIIIGRVYVDDPDDWDLPDKEFHWRDETSPYFTLFSNGSLEMRKGTLAGNYTLNFIVTEEPSTGMFPRHEVEATVAVTVKDIPSEAVVKSGSIRLSGVTAEEFVEKDPKTHLSKKDRLQLHLASVLNTSVDNVDVFTVLTTPSNSSFIDVRFSAHGSPYYSPERLNNIINLNSDEVEEILGAKIVMISISACMDEDVCPNKRCKNLLSISDEPATVFTNKTSFVGVKAVTEADCNCTPTEITCFNGGTLREGACICPEGFEGPHCQSLSIAFNGQGWAMYRTFETCNDTIEISLEITPSSGDGLIFYVGPANVRPTPVNSDFAALYLENGFPVLLTDYGSGTSKTELMYRQLTDGASHSIHIRLDAKELFMSIDNCIKSNCQQLGEPKNGNSRLNVNGPLQVGGVVNDLRQIAQVTKWNYVPPTQGLTGCVKNFVVDNYLYNLGVPGDAKNAYPDCNYGMAKAVSFGIDSKFLVAILVCIAILLILLLAVVVHRRKQDNWNEKEMDEQRETIINYQVEGGGEYDTNFDMNVFPRTDDEKASIRDNYQHNDPPGRADISGFLDNKKDACDRDPNNLPYDDVRYYAYEGDGNSTASSLSSLASCTDEGDLKFNYLSNFGPRFRKLADMYGEDPSDEDSQDGREESWC